MAERKVGTVIHRQNLSPILSIFRLTSESGSKFPDYKPGQYIALRREDCALTKRVAGADGQVDYAPDLDEHGNQKRGPVTHSYSIASAPFETSRKGYLEFCIVLEKNARGEPGRLTESLFRIDPQQDNTITYVNRIVGDFTLEKRAAGFQSVLLVGTGTGAAPFVSMVKQSHFEATRGKADGVTYTLLLTNRTRAELAYHEDLQLIEASRALDFLYIPSVSRPEQRDLDDPAMGLGRANNVLRLIFGMPLKEEEALQEATARGGDVARAAGALEKTVRPRLPRHISLKELRERLDPRRTVILTCGNPSSMGDIGHAAESNHIHFEKEDW